MENQKINSAKKNIESAKRRLLESSIPDSTKKAILNFYEQESVDLGKAPNTQLKYLDQVGLIARKYGKAFEKATEEELRSFWRKLRDGKLSNNKMLKPDTLNNYKILIPKFLKWYEGGEDYPKRIRWLKKIEIRGLRGKGLDEEKNEAEAKNFPTEEEQIKIRHHIGGTMWKLGVSIQEEAGLRPDELLSLTWMCLEEEYGSLTVKTKAHTKTGRRVIPGLLKSLKFYRMWRQEYPLEITDDAPVFVQLAGKNKHEQLSYRCFYKRLTNAVESAHIRKNITFYTYRKMKATKMALEGYPQAVCEKVMGWVPGSDVSRFYYKLTESNVKDEIYGRLGIKTEKKESKTIYCHNCSTQQPRGTEKFCVQCGIGLDVKEQERLKEFYKLRKHYGSLETLQGTKTIEDIKRVILAEMRKDYAEGKLTFQ